MLGRHAKRCLSNLSLSLLGDDRQNQGGGAAAVGGQKAGGGGGARAHEAGGMTIHDADKLPMPQRCFHPSRNPAAENLIVETKPASTRVSANAQGVLLCSAQGCRRSWLRRCGKRRSWLTRWRPRPGPRPKRARRCRHVAALSARSFGPFRLKRASECLIYAVALDIHLGVNCVLEHVAA